MKLLKTIILYLLATVSAINIGYAQDSILLDLKSAITLALEKNTDIAVANYQVSSAGFALNEAKGNFLPKLYLSANYNRNINRPVIFLPDIFGMNGTGTQLGSDNDYRGSLNLSLPIFSKFNQTNKNILQTRLDYQNEATRDVRQKVINATKKSYFTYLIAQEIVKVRENQLENAQDILTDVQKRMRQGTLTDYDLTAAKVQVAQAKNSLLEAQNTIMPLGNNLKLLSGLQPSDVLKLTEPITLMENELVIEGSTAEMVAQNSTLKQLELDIELSEKQVNLIESAFYPTVDFVGNYSYQAQANDFDVLDYRWVNTSLVGLQLQFNIFNGNITKNKVQQAKIGKMIAEEQKMYTTTAYKMQFEELLSHLNFAKQKIAVQLENMNLTEEGLLLAKKRYRYGIGTFLEVNDSELSYTQARLIWLQAISDYKTAFYDFQLLIGKD